MLGSEGQAISDCLKTLRSPEEKNVQGQGRHTRKCSQGNSPKR